MPIWEAEISFDHVINTPAPAGPYPNVEHPGFTSGIGLIVADGAGNQWVASCGINLVDDGMGNLIGGEFCGIGSKQTNPPFFISTADPWTWVGGSRTDSAGVAGYLAGGTLSVVKNFGANLITVTAPTGAVSVALDADDGVRANSGLNDTRLIPIGLAFFYIFDNVLSPTVNSQAQAEFFDMKAKEDGITYFVLPLSAAAPGEWFIVNEYLFDPALSGEEIANPGIVTSPATPIAGGQELSRYRLTGTVPAAGPLPPGTAQTAENFWRYKAHNPPLFSDTDMDAAPEHGIVWRGGPDIDNGTAMLVQRTFDNAGSWETWTAFQDDATENSSPSVTWYNQALYLTWFDGTAIKEVRSLDGGQNWNMPTTIPFTGTNPRRVVDRTGGPVLYFYFDATPNLLVVVTYDSGASYDGPYTVAASVVPQQIDAEFTPDGSLVASINVLGVLTQFRSRDLGHTWS